MDLSVQLTEDRWPGQGVSAASNPTVAHALSATPLTLAVGRQNCHTDLMVMDSVSLHRLRLTVPSVSRGGRLSATPTRIGVHRH
ncbi:hypothetical protein SBA4_4560002 [Candidatus Sulfopaludibacter sp. SbA4]|nr:hypothetical protein SBA4_4560002 [Candidatus Sulfopaludibacter sp. SbA4]